MHKKIFEAWIFALILTLALFSPVTFANDDSVLDQGIALYQRENMDEAARLLEQARKEDRASTRAARADRFSGRVHQENGTVAEAALRVQHARLRFVPVQKLQEGDD